MPPALAVVPTAAVAAEQAAVLAARLGLPLTAPGEGDYELLLAVTPQRLELRETGPGACGPVYADFVEGAVGYRRRTGGGRRQGVGRAVGLKPGFSPTVLDATAGLGRDAFVLAALGCTVTLVERDPVVAALLRDGLERALAEPDTAAVVHRMRLVEADAIELMGHLPAGERPDVVYLDPMFPARDKSALVKKEMRLFHRLLGEDRDPAGLLQAALKVARRRVVVKRPRLAPPVGAAAPSLVFTGKSTRFDVYLTAVK